MQMWGKFIDGASFALTALSDQLIRILAAIKTLLNCLECEEK